MVHKVAYNTKHGKGLKMLSTKQMLQRLEIALAQVKSVNTSENLLNYICRIIYIFFIEQKKLLKKAYNNVIDSINL